VQRIVERSFSRTIGKHNCLKMEIVMKKFLVAGAALALMFGSATAQTHMGAGNNPNTPNNSDATRMERNNNTTNSSGTTNSGTVGSSGMSKNDPAKAQPGGLSGSGGPNAGNQGGAAPGGSAGGGAGGSGR
jgi:hypothetical protein